MSAQLSSIGKRILQFIEEALVHSNSEEPISADAQLLELLSALPSDDIGWEQGLSEVVWPSVEAFRTRPDTWYAATKIASVHLSRVYTASDHARSDKSVSLKGDAATVRHPIQLHLEQRLLAGLLGQAVEQDRVTFFSQLRDGSLLRTLTSGPLQSLKLTATELATLLRSVDSEAQPDPRRGSVLQAIFDCMVSFPEPARQIIDKWIPGGEFRELGENAIALLVKAVTNSNDEAILPWRDAVIQHLRDRNEAKWWRTAAYLSCVAWPRCTDVRIRHDALLQQVRRQPEQLLATALRTIAEDAAEFPVVSIDTALHLLEMGPKGASADMRLNWLQCLAYLLEVILREDDSLALLPKEQLDKVLDLLATLPKQQQLEPIDAILEKLANLDEPRARSLLERWLSNHGISLLQHGTTLDEAFPLLDHALNKRWQFLFMISENPLLRSIATRLWNPKQSLPTSELPALNVKTAEGLIYQIAADVGSGQKWVRMVIELGKYRLDILDVAEQVLLNDAVSDYPGTCREMVERMWKTSDKVELRLAAEKILTELERRNQLWTQKTKLSELDSTHNSYPIYMERENRRLQEQMREYERSGRSLVAQIAKKQNMAYGSRSVVSFGPGRQTTIETKKYQSETQEQSLHAVVDSIGLVMRGREYLRRAADLLDARPGK